MIISEVIKKLEELKDRHGDLPVCIPDDANLTLLEVDECEYNQTPGLADPQSLLTPKENILLT